MTSNLKRSGEGMKIEEIEKLINDAPIDEWSWDICCRDDGPDLWTEAMNFVIASRTLMPKLLAVAKAAKKALHGTPLFLNRLQKTLKDLEKE